MNDPGKLISALLNEQLGDKFEFIPSEPDGDCWFIKVHIKQPMKDILKIKWGDSYEMTVHKVRDVSRSMVISMFSCEGNDWDVRCASDGSEQDFEPEVRKAEDPNFHDLIMHDLLAALDRQTQHNYDWSVEDLFNELEEQHSIVIGDEICESNITQQH